MGYLNQIAIGLCMSCLLAATIFVLSDFQMGRSKDTLSGNKSDQYLSKKSGPPKPSDDPIHNNTPNNCSKKKHVALITTEKHIDGENERLKLSGMNMIIKQKLKTNNDDDLEIATVKGFKMLFSKLAQETMLYKDCEDHSDAKKTCKIKEELLEALFVLRNNQKIQTSRSIWGDLDFVSSIIVDLSKIADKMNRKICSAETEDYCPWKNEDHSNNKTIYNQTINSLYIAMIAVNVYHLKHYEDAPLFFEGEKSILKCYTNSDDWDTEDACSSKSNIFASINMGNNNSIGEVKVTKYLDINRVLAILNNISNVITRYISYSTFYECKFPQNKLRIETAEKSAKSSIMSMIEALADCKYLLNPDLKVLIIPFICGLVKTILFIEDRIQEIVDFCKVKQLHTGINYSANAKTYRPRRFLLDILVCISERVYNINDSTINMT